MIFTAHSCMMFLLLAGRYAYQIALLIGTIMESERITVVAQLILPTIGSIYSLCGSTMLLIISNQVRNDFLEFYGWKLSISQEVAPSSEMPI